MRMMVFMGLLTVGVAMGANRLQAASEPTAQPNIVFILADDLGYTDVNCFAARRTGVSPEKMFYETPNLDRLAARGMAFEQAYANQLCSPTRASLLTGKYASRLGVVTATPACKTYYNQALTPPPGYYVHDVLRHEDKIRVPCVWSNATANTAIPRGYAIDQGRKETVITEVLKNHHAAFLGKWHVGGHGARGYQPPDLGFEGLAWYDAGGSHYFNWRAGWNNRGKQAFPAIPQDAIYWGSAGEPGDKTYLTDDLTDKAVAFIHKRAAVKDQPFFLYFCQFAVHSPWQAPEAEVAYFDQKKTKGWNGHVNPHYASMIKRLDESVGRVMRALQETGLEDNTLIVFMSDNGGLSWQSPSWPAPITSNAPLKGGKATLFEGGVRVPLIFAWRGRIPPGQWCNVPVDCNDLFPTLAAAAGYTCEGLALDGQSLVPLWTDAANRAHRYTRDTFFWHYPFNVSLEHPEDGLPLTPHSAIRKGDYKLIFDWYGRLKLFNIAEDISETRNLMKAEPERVRAMYAELIGFLEKNVEKRYWPTRDPAYLPATEVRPFPFVDLYGAFKAGGDVWALAHE